MPGLDAIKFFANIITDFIKGNLENKADLAVKNAIVEKKLSDNLNLFIEKQCDECHISDEDFANFNVDSLAVVIKEELASEAMVRRLFSPSSDISANAKKELIEKGLEYAKPEDDSAREKVRRIAEASISIAKNY